MPKRYWGLIAAIFGIAAVYGFGLGYYHAALNYPHQEGQPQYRYAADKPSEVDTALPTVPNIETLEYRRPCNNPKGKDESDLCAQWRAAKAGEDSALWAKWGFVISTIGSALLIWQIALTRKAVKDTSEATAAMRESNRISIMAAQPHVIISLGDFRTVTQALKTFIQFKIIASNVGGTGCVVTSVCHVWEQSDNASQIAFCVRNSVPIISGGTEILDPISVYKGSLTERPILRGFVNVDGPFVPPDERMIPFAFQVFPEITYPHMVHYTIYNDPNWATIGGKQQS